MPSAAVRYPARFKTSGMKSYPACGHPVSVRGGRWAISIGDGRDMTGLGPKVLWIVTVRDTVWNGPVGCAPRLPKGPRAALRVVAHPS